MAVIIHPVHRKLAELLLMIIDHGSGELRVNSIEIRLLLPLLIDNLRTVGDMDWVQEITMKLDEMEAKYS